MGGATEGAVARRPPGGWLSEDMVLLAAFLSAPHGRERDALWKSADMVELRRKTACRSAEIFSGRIANMRIVGNAICEGPAGHIVIAPSELWPLLRCLALLSPSSDAGAHVARRSVEQSLLELSSFIFCADNRRGVRFGAVTVGTDSLSLSGALTSVLPLWRSFLASSARSFMGQLPTSLSRPVHDAQQVADFIDHDRATLLIPAGRLGRAVLRAIMATWKRRYVNKKVTIENGVLIFTYLCCRHEHKAGNGGALFAGTGAIILDSAAGGLGNHMLLDDGGADGGAAAGAGLAVRLDGASVAATLGAQISSVEADGKKGVTALGCSASLKIIVAPGAPTWLLLRSSAGHNHDAKGDDPFLPMIPVVLETAMRTFAEKSGARESASLLRGISESALKVADAQNLLTLGPTLAIETVASVSALACPSSAELDRSRGLGRAPISVHAAANAAVATLQQRSQQLHTMCYCREVRSESVAMVGRRLVYCSGGTVCSLGRIFHYDCTSPVEQFTITTAGGDDFTCSFCVDAPVIAAVIESLEVASENEDEGGDADALALLADEAAGAAVSPLLSSLKATRMPYGVPGVITAYHRGAIVGVDADRLARAVRLQTRDNRTVGEDCVAIISKIHQECADNGHFCQLVATTDAAGRFTSLRLSWATREMQENALRHKLTDVVVGRDFTHNTVTSGFLLGADVGVAADGYGKSCPVAYHLVMPEVGKEDSWTQQLRGVARFIVDVMHLPEPTVQITDKDAAAIKAWLCVQQERLQLPTAAAELAALLAELDDAGSGASVDDVALARMLVVLLPAFVSVAPQVAGSDGPAVPVSAARRARSVAAMSTDVEECDKDLSRVVLPLASARPPTMAEFQAAQQPAAANVAAALAAQLAPMASGSEIGAIIDLDVANPSDAAAAIVAPSAVPSIADADHSIFKPCFAAEYSPLLPGIAAVAAEELRRITVLLKTCNSGGSWNELAAQLLWLLSISKPGSTLEKYLTGNVIRFTLLCDAHTYRALDRAFKTDGMVPTVIRKLFTAHVRDLFAGETDFVQFQAVTRPLLEESNALRVNKSDAASDFSVFPYLRDNWLSVRYFSLVSRRFRALIPRLNIDTTNIVEGEWSVLKKWHLPLLAFKTVRALVSKLSGLPLAGTEAALSRDKSMVGQRIVDMESISQGQSRTSRPYKIATQMQRIKMLHKRSVALAAAHSSLIRFDPAYSEERALLLGAYVLGGSCLAGWTHQSGDVPIHWPVPAMHMSAAQLVAAKYVTVAVAVIRSGDSLTRDEDGRSRSTNYIADAVVAVRNSSAPPSASRVSAPPNRRLTMDTYETCAQVLAMRLKGSSAGTSEYPRLIGRRVHVSGATFFDRHMPPQLVAALAGLCRQHASTTTLVQSNQNVRKVLDAFAYPILQNADFVASAGRSAGAPKAGIVYLIMVSMPASQWLAEAQRALVDGETRSKLSHRPLTLGFKVVLASMMPLAAAAVASGRGSMLLTAFYIGQERRKAGCIGDRIKEHVGQYGCPNICEVIFRTSKRGSPAHFVTPLGDGPVIVQRRILAFVGPEQDAVDFGEDVLMCLLHTIPGVVLLNNTPGSGFRRYLDDMPAGPPLVYDALTALISDGVNLHARLPRDTELPFLRRVLITAEHLLHAKRYSDDDGVPLQPALALSAGVGAQLTYSQLQCASALLTGEQRAPSRVLLYCNSCTCSRLTPVCECILVSRIVHIANKLPPVWRDTELQLHGFCKERTAEAAIEAAPAAGHVVSVVELAPSPDAERARYIASLLSLLALAPESSPSFIQSVSPRLHTMALMSLAEQRASVAGSSSHAGVHLSARRATNAAEVEEQNARHRPVFAIPADAVSCLYASLQISALQLSLPQPPYLPP